MREKGGEGRKESKERKIRGREEEGEETRGRGIKGRGAEPRGRGSGVCWVWFHSAGVARRVQTQHTGGGGHWPSRGAHTRPLDTRRPRAPLTHPPEPSGGGEVC